MNKNQNDFDPKAYNPTFEWRFLAPKYWGTWLAVILAVPFALLPLKVHKWLAHLIASHMIKSNRNAVNNIRANLLHCFPQLDNTARETLVYKSLYSAGIVMMRFSLLSSRSAKWLQANTDMINRHHMDQCIEREEKFVLFVPHSWAIDVPAVVLASQGIPLVAMIKQQKNLISDWLMHRQRVQYGGRVYERSAGIKPYVKAIKGNYFGYYSPDQDHGEEVSEFVDFFATTKATFPGLAKVAKLSKAIVIPTFASIDPETGRYVIEFLPPIAQNGSDAENAREMNQAIESFVGKQPEHYMWTLRFLRTQTDGRHFYREMRSRYAEQVNASQKDNE